MREGLWQIVTGEETAPVDGGESELIKFRTERLSYCSDCGSFSVELIGNPEDPAVIWKKLVDQF